MSMSCQLQVQASGLAGLVFEETLTGFKWMGNRATDLQAAGHTILLACVPPHPIHTLTCPYPGPCTVHLTAYTLS